MKLSKLKGSIVAMVTPMNPDGSINYDKIKELVEYHIANHTDAILTMGTTGEAPTTLVEEDYAICECAIRQADGRIPVIAGAGSNSTDSMLTKSLRFEAMGADGLLLITPYYNKSNEEGIYRHFITVADNVNLPCILYNVPSRTGCTISENNLARLSKHQNIAGIKEASGNMSYVMRAAKYINEEFALFSGNDDITIPVLSVGGSGVISVSANIIPQETHDMVTRYLNGDTAGALKLQMKFLNLINALFCEVNPIPVKEAMNLLGMGVGGYRLPLCEMAPENKERLVKAMVEAGFPV